ncbi:MAG: phenylalanine--tRNA ligase subunit beta [bacterium]
MKISYNWLKQFIGTDWPAEKTGELLTDLGLEIEGIESFESIKGGLEGVVIGKVLTCVKHPNADRLKVTTVNVGTEENLQIVCGAPNVEAGQTVPVATIGTTLYTAEGEAWKIKKGKIRGEVSEGMICAEDELGLGESHDGIMVLDNTIKEGTPASEIFEIENDQVFEIGLTPNRADAMSHFGVARDLKAGLLQKEISLELITPSVSAFHVDARSLKIEVDVQNKEKAPRYCGVTISGITVKPSPSWLQNRLKAIGLSPINNVVDATNYVLHDLGQPLHAFDATKVKGNKVIVKTLPTDSKFITLDGVERSLHEEDLMICDGDENPMCIAGVFGGLNSGVTENTTSIFLESAYFDPVSVRKTAKRHGLNTDASFRFERGIDPNTTDYALKRAALLIVDIAGGEITSDVIDEYPNKIEDYQVRLSFENAAQLIGEEIPRETIKSILTSLDIKVNNVTETGLGLTVPFYRNDVQREADVIEEILRVYGYNNIETTNKLNASIANSSPYEDHRLQNIAALQLVSQGFYEIMTNSLTSSAYTDLINEINSEDSVAMLNPLSQDLGVMRQSLLFSGLEAIAYNINRRNSNLKFFEFGKTYKQENGSRSESKRLAIFISGNTNTEHWLSESKKTNFFNLKGCLTTLFSRFGLNTISESYISNGSFSEGLTYTVNNQIIATLGVVSKKVTKALDIDQPVYYADVDWDAFTAHAAKSNIQFSDIPKYPEVKRDFALLIDNHVGYDQIVAIAQKTERKLLKSTSLFDVYEGKNLPKNKKSYGVSFVFIDKTKTLTDKQVDKVMGKLQANFEKELGATLR